jgi:serine phosphatase RsbU (regulator of sigma subunit)
MRDEDRDQTNPKNPYITGNPVVDPNLFFGQEEIFSLTRRYLEEETKGVCLFLTGDRRAGKTSLLYQMLLSGRLGDGFQILFLDMQRVGGASGDLEFFTRLAELICIQVKDESISERNYDFSQGEPIPVFEQLLDDIQRVASGKRLILLVDEVEILLQKVDNEELKQDFLGFVHDAIEEKGISFFFTGASATKDFENEKWQRLLNRGHCYELGPLNWDNFLQLLQKPMGSALSYGKGVAEGIYELTAGQPYYTQVVCCGIIDQLLRTRRNHATIEDLDEVIRIMEDNPPVLFQYDWGDLNGLERIAISLLSVESQDSRSYVNSNELLQSIQENDYPVSIPSDVLQLTLETLHEKQILDRDRKDSYRCRMGLLGRWIRKVHPPWTLEEPSEESSHLVRERTRELEETYRRLHETQFQLIAELEKELQTAHDMQMNLMPKEPPRIKGFDISGRCIPANHVGGDFFQYTPLSLDRLALCMADVTGHAMEAAIPVVMFSGILKGEMRRDSILEQIYHDLNRTLCETLNKRTFVCFVMGELDLANRSMLLSNSGCPYPVHFHSATGLIEELQIDAYPLGIQPQIRYPVTEIHLEPGDYVVFYSDGIAEMANAGGEIYGFEQTAETIRQGCGERLSAEALIDHLIGAVKAFAGETPQGDDMTCVVLKVETV